MARTKFFNIGKRDILNGLLIAFGTAFLTGLYNGIEAGTFTFTWLFFKPIVLAGCGSMILYILKNLMSNSNGELLKKENV